VRVIIGRTRYEANCASCFVYHDEETEQEIIFEERRRNTC